MFTQEEWKNILALISLAPISGKDALTVALLQQKISALITQPEPEVQKEFEEKDKKKL